MRVTWEQLDDQASAFALAHQWRAWRQREPLGDRTRQPPGMVGRAEVLGQPARRSGARELDLAVAIEQYHGSVGRRVDGERAGEAPTRLHGPQRALELRADDVEHVAVALGELAFGAPETGDDRLAPPGPDADRDLVPHSGSVQEVAVELVMRERATLRHVRQPQSRATTGRMRREQRVAGRVPDNGLERAGRLRPVRDRRMPNRTRGELDAIPGQDIRGNQLGESPQRAATQLLLRVRAHHRAGKLARDLDVAVDEPRHDGALDDTPAVTRRLGPSTAPSPWACGGPSNRTRCPCSAE